MNESEMLLTAQIKRLRDDVHSLQQRQYLLEQDYKRVPSQVTTLNKYVRLLRARAGMHVCTLACMHACKANELVGLPESILDIPLAPSANDRPKKAQGGLPS